MKKVSILLLVFMASIASAQLSIPYSADFNQGLPSGWSTELLWTPGTNLGVGQSGGMAALDHTLIVSNSELQTPYFNLQGSAAPELSFSFLLGHFSDGTSALILYADTNNAWFPIYGSSPNPAFFQTGFPQITLQSFTDYVYPINDESAWVPGTKEFVKATIPLESFKSKASVRFRLEASYYYGGVAFVDDFAITEGLSLSRVEPNRISEGLQIFPNPLTALTDLRFNKPVEEINILNSMGRLLFSGKGSFPDFAKGLELFSSGIYFLQYKETKEQPFKTIRIVVE